MATILLATWDGGGNVPPAVGIADELARRGHATHFLGHRGQEAGLSAAGHGFRGYTEAPDFAGHEPASPVRMVRLFSDRAMGRDLVTTAEEVGADLVVVDALLMGALDVVARAGLCYVPLTHLFVGYQRGPWLRAPMGGWARLRGLAPQRRWDQAPLQLAATLPALDPLPAAAPANLRVTGPVVTPPARTASFDEPAVLVSLSTFAYPGMQRVLQRVVDATATLGVPVVVTTGPALDPADLVAPPGVEVHRYLPHDEVMPEVSLVVGHGGHATTMRALAHDLPVLVLPMQSVLDQPMVGKAVQRAGAGRTLPRSSSPARLQQAVEALLAPGPHRDAAATLGAAIRGADGAAAAADALEGLLSRSGHPHGQGADR